MTELECASDLLFAIPADLGRDPWLQALMAFKSGGGDKEVARSWSAQADSFNERDFEATWRSIRVDGGIGPGTLVAMARQHGYREGRTAGSRAPRQTITTRVTASAGAAVPSEGPAAILARCEPATVSHPYIDAKQGSPDGLYVVPAGDPLRIAGESMAGALVVPVGDASLQFITVGDTAARLKAREKPTKLNLPGHKLGLGSFTVGKVWPGEPVYLCEGIGQAWACAKATGHAAKVCFGWGRVPDIATQFIQENPGATVVLVPDVGKEAEAEKIAAETGAQWVRMPAGWEQNADVNDLAQRDGFGALETLLAAPIQPAKDEPVLPFKLVPIADLTHAEPAAPLYAWEGLVPMGHVTGCGAHGGVGKTMVFLMLCVAQVLGRPLFGIPTLGGRAVFYSGEDSAGRLRFLLKLICRAMAVDVADLEGKLFLLDATDHDPTLFTEITTAGRKEGTTTSTYAALSEFLAGIDDLRLVVIDNASDTYDASEIERARVRGYMRALARIARERDAAVVLLAHVDKGTSRGERSGTEGYSGSTAWHNSARSRIFMRRETDGSLLIEHQKHNLGPIHDPVRLIWPEGGIPQLDQPFGAVVQGIADRNHERVLLRLIDEYTTRGEFVSFAHNGRSNAAKVLSQEPSYPQRLKPPQVFDLLRKCQRAGYLECVTYQGTDRKPRDRWDVTTAGRTFAGLAAASAASAGSTQLTADSAPDAEPAASAASAPLGGVGEKSAQESAQ